MAVRRALLASLLLLASCGSDSKPAEGGDKPAVPRTDVQVVSGWSESENSGERQIRVNGRLCIESRWISNVSVAATGGITCFFGGG